MTCEVEKIKGCVHIRGEMTIYDAALLKERLFEALTGDREVFLDLSAVSEIDTTGVQLLLMAHQVSVARGAKFCLRQPSEATKETFSLLRLDLPTQSPSQESAP